MATGFLRKRRQEEYDAAHAAERAAAAAAAKVAAEVAAAKTPVEPVTGPTIKAPMGGTIISIGVKAGDKVKKGQIVLVYEAMKMENEVEASEDAVVKRVLVNPGDVVGLEADLIEFE